ncbi:transcriptional regulator NrdR [Gemmatimonadota bacterium]
MRCPHCGAADDRVVDSRSSQGGAAIRRRRECLECGERFTTYEYVEAFSLIIIKRDGRREPYDRSKLHTGVQIACTRRSISSEQIDELIRTVETRLQNLGRREVSSTEVGEIVMEELRRLDQVAYVRFASVYRDFKTADEFREELDRLSGPQ